MHKKCNIYFGLGRDGTYLWACGGQYVAYGRGSVCNKSHVRLRLKRKVAGTSTRVLRGISRGIMELRRPPHAAWDPSNGDNDSEALIESVAPILYKHAPFSLLDRILGLPSTCKFCDTAPVTTMEKRYAMHPQIAEFWCCVTSIFYASGVIVYAAPRSEWAEQWLQLNHLPAYVHTCIVLGMVTATASTVYHATLWEGLGAFDCSMAIVLWFASTLTCLGLPLLYQFLVLLPLLSTFGLLWRRSTRLAIVAAVIIFPISIWSCVLKGWVWGATVVTLLCIGVVCFIVDRLKVQPAFSSLFLSSRCSKKLLPMPTKFFMTLCISVCSAALSLAYIQFRCYRREPFRSGA